MIDFFDKIYNGIENKSKFLSQLKYYSFLRFFIRCMVNILAPLYFYQTRNKKEYSIFYKNKKESEVIVTLTSFPNRINGVWLVIETILRQTRKPDRIILWLSKEQFHLKEHLPSKLLAQIKRGLDIRFVEGDIKSHKKYFYCINEFPNDYLITVDDDIFYHSRMVENLIALSNIHPGVVIAQYVQVIKYLKGKIRPYKTWNHTFFANEINNLFFGSGGGTLFPPNSLHSDVLKKDLFMTLTPTADDIWLNAMCRLNKTKILKTEYYSNYLQVINRYNISLSSINNGMNQNDIQIEKLRRYYINVLGTDPFVEIPLSLT